jgi:ribonuclease D
LKSIKIITQPADLVEAVDEMAASSVIALDTESNSRHRYPEQLCLIQIATLSKVYILDTLALNDLSPLKAVLENSAIRKIIHGADYDIRCFDRHYNYRVRNLLDTSVAARFAGFTEFGLAAIIKSLLGLSITKSEKLQQGDWGRRPLSAEALEYASSDVQHLFALQQKLDSRLEELRREKWVAEECERLEEVRYNVPDLETAFLSVKGSQNFNGAELAILRSLFLFRDEEARRQRRPPYFVMPDIVLLTLAENPSMSLSNVAGLGSYALQRFGSGLQQALSEGQTAAPIQRPRVIYERRTEAENKRLIQLKAWRTEQAAKLGLDPSLLWPTTSLERLAKNPKSFENEILSPHIRRWQREEFGKSLEEWLHNLTN